MRVLIVSADMGDGHNATGRALQEQVEKRWPEAKIWWVDTLDAMGCKVGSAFRWTYVTNVQRTPWLDEFFLRRCGIRGGSRVGPSVSSVPGRVVRCGRCWTISGQI